MQSQQSGGVCGRLARANTEDPMSDPASVSNITEQVYALLRERLAAHPDLQLPPPCFEDMQGEILQFVDGERLVVRFPVLARYRNPLGYMQGGFIAAALDNTLGPFSYLIAPPSVTTQLQLNYLRPVPPQIDAIVCTASLLERAGRNLVYQGRACSADGKTLVLAQASTQLV